MIFPRVTTKAVVVVMLVLHLLQPAYLHAHGLALVEADAGQTQDIACLAADADAGHGSTDNHQHQAGICQLDSPLEMPDFQTPAVSLVVITGRFSSTGRLLAGYVRPVYIPPKRPVQA